MAQGANYNLINPFSTGGVVSGPFQQVNGTAAAPAYSFTASPGTGMYSPGANQLGLSTNGVAALTFSAAQAATFAAGISATTGAFSGAISAIAGTAAAPAISVSTATNGFYAPAVNQVGITTNGVAALTLDASQNATFASALKLPLGTQLLSPANGTLQVTTAANTGAVGKLVLGPNAAAGILLTNAGGATLYFQTADTVVNANLACATVYATGNGAQALYQTPAGGAWGLAAPDNTHVSLMANNVHALSIDASQNAVFSSTVKYKAATASKIAAYPVVAADSATVFDNTGAAVGVTFTLPAAAVGLTYTFGTRAAQIITVAPQATDAIGAKAVNTAYASTAAAGLYFTVTCTAANYWLITSNNGFA